VIGFGARALDEHLPKYVNSPETHVYTKGKHLYGLNFSKEHVRKQNYAIITEGYFDLILPYKNGIKNIVATLGTALTPEQIVSLKRFTKNVIMIYDADKAGEAATLRSLDLLIGEDMNVRMAILPKGSDPDSFVRKEGSAGFMNALKSSKDFFDYKLGTLIAKFRKDHPRGKARIAGEMLPTLARMKNAVLRSSYLKRMSQVLEVDEDSIRAELGNVKSPAFRSAPAPTPVVKKTSRSAAEMTLLAIALEDTNFSKRIKNEPALEKIKDEHVACVLQKIREFYKAGKKITPSHLISHFQDEKTKEIISEAVGISETLEDREKVLEDCLNFIDKNSLKAALSNIQFQIREAETSSDASRVTSLIAEYNKLIQQVSNNK